MREDEYRTASVAGRAAVRRAWLLARACSPAKRFGWLIEQTARGALCALLVAGCSSDEEGTPFEAGGAGAEEGGNEATPSAGSPAAGGGGSAAGTGGSAGASGSAGQPSGGSGGAGAGAGGSAGAAEGGAGGTEAGAGGGAGAAEGGAGGAAGASGGAAAGDATFTDVLAILLDSAHNCGICHASGPGAGNGGLQFNPTMRDQTYDALVGAASAGSTGSMCGGKTYVTAGSPEDSLLYDKLANDAPSCGAKMPIGYDPLSAAELMTLRTWISNGASKD